MRETTIGLALLMTVSALPSNARAETRTLSVGTVGTMVNETGETRYLFNVSGLDRMGLVQIRRATLTLPYTLATTAEREVNLRLMPLTTDWSGSVVSWTGGWSRAGGDYDEELYSRARADLRNGSGLLTFDLTVPVKEMAEDGASLYGFLITVDEREGEGLRSSDLALVQGLANASVEVTYRTTLTGPLGSARWGR
jgi:hypothetical protein